MKSDTILAGIAMISLLLTLIASTFDYMLGICKMREM